MDSGWWLLIGVIIGVLGPLGARLLYEWIMRPQIELAEDVPLKQEEKIYHSIRITNKGKNVARQCTALLTIENLTKDDTIDNQNAILNKSSYRPIEDEPLCWAWMTYDPAGNIINPSRLSIYPNSAELLDLYAVTSGNLNIWIPSEAGWKKLRAILKSTKEYEIELKIHAENVRYDTKRHVKSFKLTQDKENDDVSISLTNNKK